MFRILGLSEDSTSTQRLRSRAIGLVSTVGFGIVASPLLSKCFVNSIPQTFPTEPKILDDMGGFTCVSNNLCIAFRFVPYAD